MEEIVESSEFLSFRKRLSKTQKQMAQILGTSIKTIHSYEQGWRTIPVHVERQIYFLATRIKGTKKGLKPCWIRKNCPFERRSQCPAGEFQMRPLLVHKRHHLLRRDTKGLEGEDEDLQKVRGL